MTKIMKTGLATRYSQLSLAGSATVFQDVAIWSSDYPHHDTEDAWDGLHHMAEFKGRWRRRRS